MGFIREFLGVPRGYRYYDTPEGEDCLKKLWFVTRECAIYGVLGSSIDVLMYSHPKGYIPTLGRYAYITFPFMGMGAAFVISTCMATNLRKKDDKWNYFIGGNAVGAIIGAWRQNIKVGVYSSAAIGFLLLTRKYCLDNGWDMFDDSDWDPRKNGHLWSIHRDFTILKDPGRNWKISADE